MGIICGSRKKIPAFRLAHMRAEKAIRAWNCRMRLYNKPFFRVEQLHKDRKLSCDFRDKATVRKVTKSLISHFA